MTVGLLAESEVRQRSKRTATIVILGVRDRKGILGVSDRRRIWGVRGFRGISGVRIILLHFIHSQKYIKIYTNIYNWVEARQARNAALRGVASV